MRRHLICKQLTLPPAGPGGSKRISSNLARICYIFGHDAGGTRSTREPRGEKRLFCRTQHLITGDADLPPFPDLSVPWNAADFENDNFSFEYQTMTMAEWVELSRIQDQPLENLSNQQKQDLQVKLEMLSSILDSGLKCDVWDSQFLKWQTFNSTVTQGGPMVDLTQMTGVHNLFSQGVAQFHVQVDAQAILKSADLLFVPSLREGASVTVREAMAIGTPVVAVNSPGVAESLDGHGWLVAPGDLEAAAAAVRTLLTDTGKREAVRQAAR